MSEFSNRFKQLKEESGLTLKELSEELDISIPNLSYYMKGREPNYDILINIANYFNVTTDWLIGRTDARSSTYEALDKEIINTIIRNEQKDISKEDISSLSIFKQDYIKTQDKLVEFMSFYYIVLHKLEELENLHPDLDYSTLNDSLTENFIESIEYQIDLLVDAQYVILSSTSNMFFEYYFNTLSRIDLTSNSYKLAICNMLKIVASNFDGNSDKLSVIVDFLKQTGKYAQNCISNTELSSFFERHGL